MLFIREQPFPSARAVPADFAREGMALSETVRRARLLILTASTTPLGPWAPGPGSPSGSGVANSDARAVSVRNWPDEGRVRVCLCARWPKVWLRSRAGSTV